MVNQKNCSECKIDFIPKNKWMDKCKDCYKKSIGYIDCPECKELFNSKNHFYKVCYLCNTKDMIECEIEACKKLCKKPYLKCYTCNKVEKEKVEKEKVEKEKVVTDSDEN